MPSKVEPRTVRVQLFIMAVDPYHRYSNERANEDVYDDFKLKNPFSFHGLYKNILAIITHPNKSSI